MTSFVPHVVYLINGVKELRRTPIAVLLWQVCEHYACTFWHLGCLALWQSWPNRRPFDEVFMRDHVVDSLQKLFLILLLSFPGMALADGHAVAPYSPQGRPAACPHCYGRSHMHQCTAACHRGRTAAFGRRAASGVYPYAQQPYPTSTVPSYPYQPLPNVSAP